MRHDVLERMNILLLVRRGENRIELQRTEDEPRKILLFVRHGGNRIELQRFKREMPRYPPS